MLFILQNFIFTIKSMLQKDEFYSEINFFSNGFRAKIKRYQKSEQSVVQ